MRRTRPLCRPSIGHVRCWFLLSQTVIASVACRGRVDSGSRDGQLIISAVNVVMPRDHVEDSTMAALLRATVRTQRPFPGLPQSILERGITVEVVSGGHGGADAFAIPALLTIYLPHSHARRWSQAFLHRTVRHELAHIALHTAIKPAVVPHWFSEGYATWASGPLSCYSATRISVAVMMNREHVSSIMRLGGPPPLGSTALANDLYASAVDHLVATMGETNLARFLRQVRRGGFAAAMVQETGLTEAEFEARWQSHLVQSFGYTDLDTGCDSDSSGG
jgi:hypothetical protein